MSDPVPLDRERIVSAAIALADAEGLDAVSVRRVAGVLGAGPMRLYTHVATKADLLDLMVERVYAEMAASLPDGAERDWRSRMHGIGAAFRRVAFRHAWFVDLLSGRPRSSPAALTVLDASAAALAAAPGKHTPAASRVALGAVNAYLLGATRADLVELAVVRAEGDGGTAWEAGARGVLAEAVAEGRYPALARLTSEWTPEDAEAEFADGLDIVLDGIASGSDPLRPARTAARS